MGSGCELRNQVPHSLALPMNSPPPLVPAEEALPEPVLSLLAEAGKQREYRKGTMLITEGDEGDTLFVIMSGRVKVFANDSHDREVTYAVYGPGNYFGEMSLDGGPRSASVITLEPSVCSVVTRRALREFMIAHPEFSYHLLTTVIQRARQSTRIARSLALDDVYSRLIRFLESSAAPQPDATRLIPERMTHQEIASRIGASREMVSRILKDLETGGYLAMKGRHLVLVGNLPERW